MTVSETWTLTVSGDRFVFLWQPAFQSGVSWFEGHTPAL